MRFTRHANRCSYYWLLISDIKADEVEEMLNIERSFRIMGYSTALYVPIINFINYLYSDTRDTSDPVRYTETIVKMSGISINRLPVGEYGIFTPYKHTFFIHKTPDEKSNSIHHTESISG
jgi:hypothetical protein